MKTSVPSVGSSGLFFFTIATADNCVQVAEVSNLASRTTETSVCTNTKRHRSPTLNANEIASVDDHLQRVGAESFDLFQRCVATAPQSRVRSYNARSRCVDYSRKVNNLDKEVCGC